MLTTKKTRDGWIITEDGCRADTGMLVAGAMAGERRFYRRETLNLMGLDYAADPNGVEFCQACTVQEWLWHEVSADRLVSRGHEVK